MNVVRVHSAPSNRVKHQNDADRKVVFKSVLENPYRIQWPAIPANVQNAILACAVETLKGVDEYHLARDAQSRRIKNGRAKRKKAEKAEKAKQSAQVGMSRKRRKLATGQAQEITEIITNTGHNDKQSNSADNAAPSTAAKRKAHVLDEAIEEQSVTGPAEPKHPTLLNPPPMLKHLTFGINEITKRLERQISEHRKVTSTVLSTNDTSVAPSDPSITSAMSQPSVIPALRVILVCRGDVDPPLLLAHIPHLVATCNSTNLRAFPGQPNVDSEDIKLVSVPKGAEHVLAQAAGLRRVAVMALDAQTPNIAAFLAFLTSVPVLQAPWLITPKVASLVEMQARPARQQLVPTTVKQLRTSAPKDSRVNKEHRKKARAQAKAKRREPKKLAPIPKVIITS